MKRLLLTILIIHLMNNYVFSQVKVGTATGSSTNTYNITNSADGTTLRAQSGALRVHERQFVEVLNETGFASAVTVAAASGYNVRVTNLQSITSDVSVPDSVFVEFVGAGRLGASSVYTVTFNGGYSGPRKRIFYGSITVKTSGMSAVFPEHFGAKRDSTFDSGVYFQKAFDAFLPYSRGYVELASGGKYLINTTVKFPRGYTGREINLVGNDALVYNTNADTVFIINNVSNSSNGPHYPRHSIDRLWMKQIGTAGTGIALVVWNTVEAQVKYCNVTDFNKGILFLNTLQNGVAGWTEGIEVHGMRFNACDTSIVFKNILGGANSFRWNSLTYNQFGMGEASNRNLGRRIYGIATYPGANNYQNNWDGNNFAALDSCFAIYCNGILQGSKGFITYEMFGSGSQDESGIFQFGSSATNAQVDFFVGYEGLNRTESFIRYANTLQITGIKTQVRADGNNQNRGISTVVNPTAFTRLESVVNADSVAAFKANFETSKSYFWVKDVNSDGQIILRIKNSQPLQLYDVESGSSNRLAKFNGMELYTYKDTSDAVNLNFATSHYIRLSDVTAAKDTVKYFKNGVRGQIAYISYVDDSTTVQNLAGGAYDLFLLDNRNINSVEAGTKSFFIAEIDGDGVFWREMFRTMPMNTATWNPGNIAAAGTDSTTVTYLGAVVGDPVEVGFAGIGSAGGGNWQLWGHVVANNSVKIFLKNNGAAAYNPASATLRFRVRK